MACVVIGSISFVLNGWVIPQATKSRLAFELQYFNNRYYFDARNIHLQMSPDVYLFIQNYNNVSNTGYQFTLERFEKNEMIEKLTADNIRWDSTKQKWKLSFWKLKKVNEVFQSTSQTDLSQLQKSGDSMDTTLAISPKDFEAQERSYDGMTMPELNAHIAKLKFRGATGVQMYEVEKQIRYASPFTTFVLVFMGVVVSSRKSRGGTGLQIALGFVLAFIFILFFMLSRTFAEAGEITPLVAAWIPNIVFLDNFRCYLLLYSAMTPSTVDNIKLHSIVFLFGFTGILGKLVSIPAVEMVFYRSLLAAMGMAVLLISVRGSFKISTGDFFKLILTGFIVALHWITFFLSARVANVSVSLVGFATASLWTAFLEPLAKGQRIKPIEVIFGSIVLSGLYVIFASDFSYSVGLLLGVLSGLTCAVFSIINSQLVKRVDSFTITFYEMSGACVSIALFLPVYQYTWANGNELRMLPSLTDWVCIALLAWLCSVYAYSAAVELTKRLSVFTFQLALNLEPVYGIIMAVIIFGDEEKMNINFYLGTLIILCAVLVYPIMRNRFTTIPTNQMNP
ncbi:MAG: LptF/LptG family permease [Bacteroidota bacterium]